MIARDVDLNQEWKSYRVSHPESNRDAFFNGAFSVYKMLVTAEDDKNKLREVMYRLGEQFREEFKS